MIDDHPTTHSPAWHVAELQLVIASQREVIASLQAERETDHATIERLTAELTALLRTTD